METRFRGLVSFRLLDVLHPRPVDVLFELHEQTRLEGEVIGVTDDGREYSRFLVVQVRGLSEPVLVPTGKAVSVSSPPVCAPSWIAEKTHSEG